MNQLTKQTKTATGIALAGVIGFGIYKKHKPGKIFVSALIIGAVVAFGVQMATKPATTPAA